ncbi:MAG: MFS transporter, partial [Planctomycetia bacterium]
MKISGTAYVFLVALVAAAGGFLFGFDLSLASGALPFLKEQFKLDAAGEGLAMSSAILGSIAGPLAGMWLADRIGRRATLAVAAICFMASAIGTALPRSIMEFNV